MKHNYTITLHPYGNVIGAGFVQISPSTKYGYWEHRDGSEGGGFWLRGKELTDFDGDYMLPKAVVKILRDNGYALDEAFD